jgi:CheY-like chemotaxis protein
MSEEKTIEKPLVLIIDDMVAHIRIRSEILMYYYRGDIDIVASDGAVSGLEIAKKYHPDLIIVDMVMPNQNGLYLINGVRNDKQIADTPIMLATMMKADLHNYNLDLRGAVPVTKPFSPGIAQQVDELLRTHTSNKR